MCAWPATVKMPWRWPNIWRAAPRWPGSPIPAWRGTSITTSPKSICPMAPAAWSPSAWRAGARRRRRLWSTCAWPPSRPMWPMPAPAVCTPPPPPTGRWMMQNWPPPASPPTWCACPAALRMPPISSPISTRLWPRSEKQSKRGRCPQERESNMKNMKFIV